MKYTIAIIDDEEGVRKSIAAVLATYGFETVSYSSARGFLESESGRNAACALMDIRMPEMDGLQAFQAMREEGIATPVIFITGHADIRLAVKCVKAGAAESRAGLLCYHLDPTVPA